MSDLAGNPKDRFSHVAARMFQVYVLGLIPYVVRGSVVYKNDLSNLREPAANHRALGGNSKISVLNDTLPLDSTY